jgi:hypothetical protein
MAKAAGGTSQRLKPGPATVFSRVKYPGFVCGAAFNGMSIPVSFFLYVDPEL